MKNPEEEFDMNKTELVAALAEKAEVSKKDAEIVILSRYLQKFIKSGVI